MEVSTNEIKELRERTSAGMMDCKKALMENNSDMEKAIEWLREKGLSKAAKKAGRIAAEGMVEVSITDGIAAMVEVNSETDFVSKNENFRTYVKDVAEQVAKTQVNDTEDLLNQKWLKDQNKTVKDVLTEKISTIGENLSIRRFVKLNTTDGVVVPYIHGGGKIGVFVKLNTTNNSDAVIEAGKNIAMQVAAINPLYLSSGEIPADYVESEKAILREQALSEGKPAEIVEKMIAGRLNKQLQEVCLLEQNYVKDPEVTITKYLESVSKQVGTEVKVVSFVRFETGEGIQKKEENFADEVAAQVESMKK
ncbi:MAG TPA: elongation factor Ts [Clostridiales bacterium]|nr:MAG: translation elongation factor Ts [Clostridiales bacterium GWD2_32_19]HCC06689.1 elongation factor Ts [Clostridiales bacterium]